MSVGPEGSNLGPVRESGPRTRAAWARWESYVKRCRDVGLEFPWPLIAEVGMILHEVDTLEQEALSSKTSSKGP